MKNLDKFAEKKTLIFDSIHYLHIFVWLMTKRYDKLADNIVNLDNMFSSKEEAIAVMKERTRRYVTVPPSSHQLSAEISHVLAD